MLVDNLYRTVSAILVVLTLGCFAAAAFIATKVIETQTGTSAAFGVLVFAGAPAIAGGVSARYLWRVWAVLSSRKPRGLR